MKKTFLAIINFYEQEFFVSFRLFCTNGLVTTIIGFQKMKI